MTSYGFSGENENSLRADRPLASRNSKRQRRRSGRRIERLRRWV